MYSPRSSNLSSDEISMTDNHGVPVSILNPALKGDFHSNRNMVTVTLVQYILKSRNIPLRVKPRQ